MFETRQQDKKYFYVKYFVLEWEESNIISQTSGGAFPAQSGGKEEREEEKSGWRWRLNHPGCHVLTSLLECRAVTDCSGRCLDCCYRPASSSVFVCESQIQSSSIYSLVIKEWRGLPEKLCCTLFGIPRSH